MQEDRDLAARLDLLMDHLEENMEKEEDARKAQILSSVQLNPDAKTDFLRCIGLLKTNALEVSMGKARALFPMFSFLSHLTDSISFNSLADSLPVSVSQLRPKAQELYAKLDVFMKEKVYPVEKEVIAERFGEERWQPHPKLEELKA